MTRAAAVSFALALALPGCALAPPPVTQGFVSTDPAPRGTTNLEAHGMPVGLMNSGGGQIAGLAAVNAEPFVRERLSIPVGITAGGRPFFGGARVGLRYRPDEYPIAVGIGGGPGLTVRRPGFAESSPTGFLVGDYGAIDLELLASKRWKRFALSGGIRPAVSVWVRGRNVSFYGLVELNPAVFFTERIGMTVNILTGPLVFVERKEDGTYTDPQALVMLGGGLGLFVRFDPADRRGR